MNRLYPRKDSGRYYILTLLRLVNEQLLSEVDRSAIILDYGCGNMPYRPLFEEKCKRYIGIDFASNLNADLHILNSNIPLENEAVDIVISTQVLEHVEFPEEYLMECQRVLKKGGKLFLSTHGHWKYHPDPTDFWRWTEDGLLKTIEKSFFKVNKVYGLMGLSASGLQFFQDGLSPRLYSCLRPLFFRLIAFLQTVVDRTPLSNKDASVFYVIATKKSIN